MPQPPPREATGDGEEGDVASRESMRLATTMDTLEPDSLYLRPAPVDWTLVQCGNMTITRQARAHACGAVLRRFR